MEDIDMLFVDIDWGMAYLFGDQDQQVEQVPVESEAHAKWVIEAAYNNGAESAELIEW